MALIPIFIDPQSKSKIRNGLKPCFLPLRPVHSVSELRIADRRLRQAPVTAQQPVQIPVIFSAELAFICLSYFLVDPFLPAWPAALRVDRARRRPARSPGSGRRLDAESALQ